MNGVPRSPWASRLLHQLALGALTLAVVLQYGLHEYPLQSDRAYFVYMGQAILRGEPIYATTFFGYPPLPMLLSAASMWLGSGFDLPTYLAPRYAGVLVAVLSVCTLYVVASR